MADRKLIRATEPFDVYLPDGRPFAVRPGDLLWSDDPIVSKREHLFGEVVVRSSAPPKARDGGRSSTQVETASAAPGTKRTTTAPKGGGSSA